MQGRPTSGKSWMVRTPPVVPNKKYDNKNEETKPEQHATKTMFSRHDQGPCHDGGNKPATIYTVASKRVISCRRRRSPDPCEESSTADRLLMPSRNHHHHHAPCSRQVRPPRESGDVRKIQRPVCLERQAATGAVISASLRPVHPSSEHQQRASCAERKTALKTHKQNEAAHVSSFGGRSPYWLKHGNRDKKRRKTDVCV